MATSTPYNIANGSAGTGTAVLTLTVGTGTGSPGPSSAGDMVYILTSDGLNEAPVTIVDSQGNTYTAQVIPTTGTQRVHLWTSPGTTPLTLTGNGGGPDTITITFPSSTGNKIGHACGAPGVSATVDKQANNNGNSTAPSSGASGALSQASELVVGGIRGGSGSGTPTGLSFGSALAVTQSAVQTEFHQVVTATTTKTASGTITSAQWGALVATFRISLPVITTTTVPNATSGSVYSQPLNTAGGLPAYSYAITSGSLTGSGLTLSAGGVLSGTATGGCSLLPDHGHRHRWQRQHRPAGADRHSHRHRVHPRASRQPGIRHRVNVARHRHPVNRGKPARRGPVHSRRGTVHRSRRVAGRRAGGGGGGLMGERNKTFPLVTGAGVTGMSTAISYIGSVGAASTGAVVGGVPTTWPASAFDPGVKIQIFDYQPNLTDTPNGTLDAQHTGFFTSAPAGSWVMPYHEPGVGQNNNPTGAQIIAVDRHLIALKNRVAPSLWYVRGMATLGGNVDTSVWIDSGQAFTSTLAAPAVFTSSPALDAAPNGLSVILKGAGVPAGFTAGQVYYVVAASGTTFQLAATIGGTGIAATSTGSGTVVPVPDAFGMDGYQHATPPPKPLATPSSAFAKSIGYILAANPNAKIAIIETGTAVQTPTAVAGVTAWLNAIGVYAQANPNLFSVNTYWGDPANPGSIGSGSQAWSNAFAPAEQALANVMAGGGSSDVEIWYYPNCPAGITTATFTGPAGVNCRGAIAEFASPAGTSQALDGPGGTAGGAGPATNLPVAAQQSSAAGDLGIAVFGDFFSSSQSGSWTTPAGWTINATLAGGAANLFAFYEKTGLGAGVQSVTGQYSVSAGQTSWAGAVAMFSPVFSSPVVTTTTLGGGTVSAPFPATTMAATGGTGTLTWSAGAGKPPGTLLSSAGVWSGTPTTPGSYPFNVTVTDQNGATGLHHYTVVIAAQPVISTSGLPAGVGRHPVRPAADGRSRGHRPAYLVGVVGGAARRGGPVLGRGVVGHPHRRDFLRVRPHGHRRERRHRDRLIHRGHRLVGGAGAAPGTDHIPRRATGHPGRVADQRVVE